ncbi:MAG: hypothetical protein KTR19_10980 [Hyphomicrobiales bacterium]|nr:hypothetical protein [Hyphomicrobiales bacterium]
MGFLTAFHKKPTGDCQILIERLALRIGECLQGLQLKGSSLSERSLTLIARSPSSEIARALALQAETLQRNDISARIIFARLSPIELVAELASALSLTAGRDSKESSVRILKSPALLNAHEQLVIGEHCCWTGDMLRRAEGNRNGLDIWKDNSDHAAKLAHCAFNAIWPTAKPVPSSVLTGRQRILRDSEWLNASMTPAGIASSFANKRAGRSSFTQH